MRTDDPSRPRPLPYRRHWGGLVVAAVALAAIGVVATSGYAWIPPGIHKFTIVVRAKYQRAPGPLSTLTRGLPPKSSTTNPLPASKTIEAVRIFRGHIELDQAGKAVRTISTPRSVSSLSQVVRKIHDPAWLSRRGSTIYARVGVVIDRGAKISIAAPATTRVVLYDHKSVLLGVQHRGSLTLKGVSVTSTAPHHPKNHLVYRPAIVASNRGRLVIRNSRISDLGWDWNAGYGVSWVNGATGGAYNSTFEDGFIGAYTSTVVGERFIGDTFRNNDLYGLDPHTHSRNLLVSHVVAENNAAHGIIFSQYVTHSAVVDSIARRNGENGIMMDLQSTHNLIKGDVTEDNHGDGIVTANSPRTTITGNHVRRNRVGIRITPAGGARVTNNTITDNQEAGQGTALQGNNRTSYNGGQFRTTALIEIWIAVAMGILAVAAMLFGSRWASRKRKRAPHPSPSRPVPSNQR